MLRLHLIYWLINYISLKDKKWVISNKKFLKISLVDNL